MGKGSKIIVCPNTEKLRILQSFSRSTEIPDVTFLTKEEFLHQKLFSYNEKAIFYLMKKYSYSIDVCKVYLNALYGIDEKKNYQNEKCKFLKELKIELMKENLLLFHPSFQKSLSNREVEVRSYYDLDRWEEEALSYTLILEEVFKPFDVFQFSTMEEEVNFVCIQISELLKKGIDLSHIFLCNVSEEYYYTIEKLFSYYHIPIMIPYRHSIYGNSIVQKYLKTGEIDVESSNPIVPLLVSTLNSLADLEEGPIQKEILKDTLKHTYYPHKKYQKAVNICELTSRSFGEEDYVFVLGFNQDVLPKMKKDNSYLSDSDKEEYPSYTTVEWNKREKKIVSYVLQKIPNLTVSYKLSSPFSEYYPSYLIDEIGCTVRKDFMDSYSYSNLYNQIRLGEKLDDYRFYGEEKPFLKELQAHYHIPYCTYSNEFQGISKDSYLTHLDYPLKLSYTSFNTYQECKFHYYCKYVLKLDSYEDVFPAFIGSLFHKILSCCFNESFDFEKEYQAYLEKRDLSLKEVVLLNRIKKEILSFLSVLKKQKNLTGFDDVLYEQKIEVPIRDDISVSFVGYLDKILYYQKIEDTYFAIIDYKTGTIDTHLEPMKYGLHMQLPVYLYLIHYGKVFQNPIFGGIYYQNILFDYPKWGEETEKRFFLDGYSTDDISILERLDSTYEESSLIKGMKYSDEKFDRSAKVLSSEEVDQMVSYTKQKIENTVDEIIEGDFSINPKYYGKENISCSYCPFQDLCFMKEKDLVSLPKVEDFSFLGGDL